MTRAAIKRVVISMLPFTLLITAGWALFLHMTCTGDGRESFRDKFEWSVLQSLEAQHRNTAIFTTEFTKHEDCQIICIPASNGERIWIMLNPHSPPYYKQMPPCENYSLSEEQYQQIVRDYRPISTVDECLRSHIRRKP